MKKGKREKIVLTRMRKRVGKQCSVDEAEDTPDYEETNDNLTSIEISQCKENAGGFKPVNTEIMKQKNLLTDNPSMFVILAI